MNPSLGVFNLKSADKRQRKKVQRNEKESKEIKAHETSVTSSRGKLVRAGFPGRSPKSGRPSKQRAGSIITAQTRRRRGGHLTRPSCESHCDQLPLAALMTSVQIAGLAGVNPRSTFRRTHLNAINSRLLRNAPASDVKVKAPIKQAAPLLNADEPARVPRALLIQTGDNIAPEREAPLR